ncbi:MAG: hypothetical protein KAT07_11225 [Calditrichia bacterium]|nr:hypothetical protein [Calditrichia bacterium]
MISVYRRTLSMSPTTCQLNMEIASVWPPCPATAGARGREDRGPSAVSDVTPCNDRISSSLHVFGRDLSLILPRCLSLLLTSL